MRVIKFRAWDVKHSLYESVHNLYWFEENGVSEQNEDGTFDGHYTNWVLEQFTGRLDKNGVEIYEGDILATSNSDPHYDIWAKEDNSYTVVQWSASLSGFRGSTWDWDVDNEDESIYSLSNFVEVIGNIHENPELLK